MGRFACKTCWHVAEIKCVKRVAGREALSPQVATRGRREQRGLPTKTVSLCTTGAHLHGAVAGSRRPSVATARPPSSAGTGKITPNRTTQDEPRCPLPRFGGSDRTCPRARAPLAQATLVKIVHLRNLASGEGAKGRASGHGPFGSL